MHALTSLHRGKSAEVCAQSSHSRRGLRCIDPGCIVSSFQCWSDDRAVDLHPQVLRGGGGPSSAKPANQWWEPMMSYEALMWDFCTAGQLLAAPVLLGRYLFPSIKQKVCLLILRCMRAASQKMYFSTASTWRKFLPNNRWNSKKRR